jgi:TolB-like protein
MRYALLLAGTFAILSLTGCTSGYHVQYLAPQVDSRPHISAAVLPLVNLTTHPYAGKIVGDLLSTELHRIPGVHFSERTALQQTLADDGYDSEQLMDRTAAQQAGKTLGVEHVFYGSVTEYRYRRGLDQSPAVGINLRLLDVIEGRELWSASMSKTGSQFFGSSC